jgi:L-amino acid N-acyltransferase YncA
LATEPENPHLSIRAASLADAAQIADIYNYYVANTVITFEEHPVSADEMSARIVEVRTQDLPWLVAEADGSVVGFSYATRWKARSAYRHSVETTIYLKDGHSGRGVGRTLYSALFPILRQQGMHAVIGGAALPNAASVALHESLGFERVATFRQVGFKHDRWVDVAYWQLLL